MAKKRFTEEQQRALDAPIVTEYGVDPNGVAPFDPVEGEYWTEDVVDGEDA